jgi:hypothetical protein
MFDSARGTERRGHQKLALLQSVEIASLAAVALSFKNLCERRQTVQHHCVSMM